MCLETKRTFLDDYPRLKKEWNYRRNNELGLYPGNLSYGSDKKVWWKCEKTGHEWQASIVNRIRKRNCPYCSGRKLCDDGSNSLYAFATDIVREEWNEEKNGSMKLYNKNSHKRVWWKCRKTGHEWQAGINNRMNGGTNCPYCCNRKMCEDGSNSLYMYVSKRLKQEWNEEKNGSMKLYSLYSNKKVWWKCIEKGHEWQAVIFMRTREDNRNCPFCNKSKLEYEFISGCSIYKELQIDEQKIFDDCKNIKRLPYDFYLQHKTHKIRVELQGEQHFNSSHYFYLNNSTSQEFIDRLNIDNKKSYSAFKACDNFLSISYLCQGEISIILSRYLEDLENYDIVLRYYITPYIYLQYSKSNDIVLIESEMVCEHTDEMLLIYRIFLHQIESLQDPVIITEENFTECCKKLYFKDTIDVHKMIKSH